MYWKILMAKTVSNVVLHAANPDPLEGTEHSHAWIGDFFSLAYATWLTAGIRFRLILCRFG